MSFNERLLQALNGDKLSYPPTWLMRQAGRYMPEYMAVRSKVSFLELCKTPELACEVTLQPVDILGVDAAILFSDILIPVEPMGVKLDFNPAPVISNPVRTQADADALSVPNPLSALPYVYETIRLLVSKLNVPLIGFSGAPFTLACYMVEGGGSKNYTEIKKLMHSQPKVYATLMEKLTDSTYLYLQGQIDAGCPVVQIFDTWAGVLSPDDYREFVLPYVKNLTDRLNGAHVIYFAKDGAAYFEDMKSLNCAGMGLDWKTDIDKADAMLDHKFCLQGNMDPALLFTDKDTIRTAAHRILERAKGVKGHIFNLGHGIMPGTPVENVKFLVDTVKEGL
jgi:uroporphyrinogen decarboxylase